MFGYYLSLSGFERFLLILGILSLSIALINAVIELLEVMDRGIRKQRQGRSAVLLSTSAVCLFAFLALLMISKGLSWYMAYPLAVLAALVYCFVSVVFLGAAFSRQIRPMKTDKRVAIGRTGLVYKTVLPDSSTGCVSVDVFGATIESYAISASGEAIPIGTIVKIIDLDDDILVCEEKQ